MSPSPFKGQTGLKRILNATGYSLAGFLAAFRGEAAFRQLVLLNVVLIPVANSWDSLLGSLDKFSSDFPGEREQPGQPGRRQP